MMLALPLYIAEVYNIGSNRSQGADSGLENGGKAMLSLWTFTLVVLAMELRIHGLAGSFRGGLGDLDGALFEGAPANTIFITYGYPLNWQTKQPMHYELLEGAREVFYLDVDVYFPGIRRTMKVVHIVRGNAQLYILCPSLGLFGSEEGDILYPGSDGLKLEQQALFGRAAEALLVERRIKPKIVWCQEWLAAATAMPSMRSNTFFDGTKFLFTNHTAQLEALTEIPIAWFDGLSIDRRYQNAFTYKGMLNLDRGCIALADMVTGVSPEHGEVLREMYPEFAGKIVGLLNGLKRDNVLSVHLKGRDNASDQELLHAHRAEKDALRRLVKQHTGVEWSDDDLIVGLVRRLAGYKNQFPMFEPIIRELAKMGVKVLIGGLPHEKDGPRREWAEKFEQWMQDPELKGNFVYLREYSESIRLIAAQGCDIWVECPLPKKEACGTSPIIAKINGNLVIATRGGGVKEHGKAIVPITATGDTLFIDPYHPETLLKQIRHMQGWYEAWREGHSQLWPKLRRNAFESGKLLDIAGMYQRYYENCFKLLLGNDNKPTVVRNVA